MNCINLGDQIASPIVKTKIKKIKGQYSAVGALEPVKSAEVLARWSHFIKISYPKKELVSGAKTFAGIVAIKQEIEDTNEPTTSIL